MEKNSKLLKILPYIIILLYCVLTLKGIFAGRIPYEDESHTWTICAHSNLFQIIDLMKVEGHFLLWYIFLMPFCKNPDWYPLSMYILNWVFCLLAVVVMWAKSPFSIVLKMFITFSAPFFSLYALHARCYSIGILFLFLALSFYSTRIERPYRYLAFLLLTLNTNFPCALIASFLGLTFIYDIRKNKKALFITLFAAFLNLALLYIQFAGVHMPDYMASLAQRAPYRVLQFFGFAKLLEPDEIIKIWGLRIFCILFPFALFKSKRAFIYFISASSVLLYFFTFIYQGMRYHIAFLYIIALSAYWIYKTELKQKLPFCGILITLLTFSLMYTIDPFESENKCIADEILSTPYLREGKVYCGIRPITLAVNIPYLEKEGIYIYDLQGRNLSTPEAFKIYFNKEAKVINPDKLALSFDKEKTNYFIIGYFLKNNTLTGHDYKIMLKPLGWAKSRGIRHMYIYEVTGVQKRK